MSKRNKLQKFAEVAAFEHVYENFDPEHQVLTCCGKVVSMRGAWGEKHFNNHNPITLELACGKGEYTVGLSQMFPQRNIIGVDVKGARIWKGAGRTLEYGLSNAAFLRTRIEMLANFFEQGEVDEIWIVFPDPFPRESKANRRLTAPPFLDIYRKVVKPDGFVHLKTDDQNLYEFTLETLQAHEGATLLYHNDDIYKGPLPFPELDIKTFYERQHLAAGKTIKYIRFSLSV
jgi:tRNA (guanine-N7-)-methyltransferase